MLAVLEGCATLALLGGGRRRQYRLFSRTDSIIGRLLEVGCDEF